MSGLSISYLESRLLQIAGLDCSGLEPPEKTLQTILKGYTPRRTHTHTPKKDSRQTTSSGSQVLVLCGRKLQLGSAADGTRDSLLKRFRVAGMIRGSFPTSEEPSSFKWGICVWKEPPVVGTPGISQKRQGTSDNAPRRLEAAMCQS